MEILVVVETLLLVLIGLLVAGLLRSHGEILRRLEAIGEGAATPAPGRARPDGQVPAPVREGAAAAHDLAGSTLRGEPIAVAVRTPATDTLLAFLSSGCATCVTFWEALRPEDRRSVPGNARVVVVTKDPAYESPSKLRDLAPAGVPVVMSSDAWDAYDVPGSPYFVFVDGASGTIHGEGMAQSWDQVLSLLRDALDDSRFEADRAPAADGSMEVPRRGGNARASRLESELASAGIGEGHPSLYSPDDSFGSSP